MTREEAIEVLKDWDGYFIGHSSDDVNEALEIAIEAINKQIPQAVYLTGDGEWDGQIVYDTARCQSCGFTIDESDSDWEANYCPECGQRLKWFEEAEEVEN